MKLAALLAIGLPIFVMSSEHPSSAVTSHPAATAVRAPVCSDGWRITGYYTPVETDFTSSDSREIDVVGIGKQIFNSDFLRTIFNEDKGYGEGWGKTHLGWYLGNYHGKWHKADAPLDAADRPLEPNTVAVDNSVIPRGSMVVIPALPAELAHTKFVSNDVGISVHGKHIDVYTGEGNDARRRMYAVTFEEDDRGLTEVCFSPPSAD